MLVIRKEQIRVFEEARLREWLADYLKRSYPAHCAQLTNRAVSAIVESGMTRGRALGLRVPTDLRKFVHVTFLLGTDFESNGSLGWAVFILHDEEQPDPAERVALLEQAILEKLTEGRMTAAAAV